jgi:MarR family transcriptional regulator for hemolysin
MLELDYETFGPLLHGTARAWRLKLDERLKPMGLSQAKWRTLLHLSLAPGTLTQTEIAARLGIEEPSLVTLLNRLESERWVARRSSPHDRRCKVVYLGRRAQRIITQINAAADELRHQLLSDISASELQTCIKVLTQIRGKAEKRDKLRRNELPPVHPGGNGQDRERHPIAEKGALRRTQRRFL